jgi:hypothetical protein
MTRLQKVLIVILVVLGVLTLSYLLRNVAVPPDCLNQPEAPACRGPK